MPSTDPNSAYMSVYMVVKELCSGHSVPIGLAGTMYSALDQLRDMAAPRTDISLAERISVTMHKLEWAIRSGDAGDQVRLRAELEALGADWLDTPISKH
jgi:hypothetical protein